MDGQRRRRGLRVLVIGGGIGGLCLAQGLRAAGVDVRVFERDTAVHRRQQGYRLHISPDGERALRECLPPEATALLVATANTRYGYGMAVYDDQLNEQGSPQFTDPRAGDPDKVDAVDRVTLRHVLLAGLGDVVSFGKQFTAFELTPEGAVTARFADGTSATGDVLVAADGSNSTVREQCRPGDRPSDLGIRTIFGRIPVADAVRDGLPEVLQDRFTWVMGSDGHKLGLMPMAFRTPPVRAARDLWPGLAIPDAEDYFMAVFSMHRSVLGMTDEELFAMDGAALWRLVRERTTSWHPHLRTILASASVEATFAVAVRAMHPIEPWQPGPVIPLGDAVHAMPPSGGVGANTAVRDAAVLCRALTAVDRGDLTPAAASAAYQEEMLKYATESLNTSLDVARWSLGRTDLDD
ncbi:FAD-dependent monooxygenase [Nonomuraea sp. NBC_01738]|uniref:FAD-dependent oxidoreductase n=1 Tax=Nonomuraea sp. NBC_01738 TaxID=2976003 RepID=UPI002E0E5ED8|nr:FAD-dependent monooxygenase [Nonomuraea sp. NBC_01738]